MDPEFYFNKQEILELENENAYLLSQLQKCKEREKALQLALLETSVPVPATLSVSAPPHRRKAKTAAVVTDPELINEIVQHFDNMGMLDAITTPKTRKVRIPKQIIKYFSDKKKLELSQKPVEKPTL